MRCCAKPWCFLPGAGSIIGVRTVSSCRFSLRAAHFEKQWWPSARPSVGQSATNCPTMTTTGEREGLYLVEAVTAQVNGAGGVALARTDAAMRYTPPRKPSSTRRHQGPTPIAHSSKTHTRPAQATTGMKPTGVNLAMMLALTALLGMVCGLFALVELLA